MIDITNTIMNWKIVLTGDKFDLENLSKDLKEKDLSIVQENEQFILKSEEFNSLSDYHEVKGKVIEILNSVNAVALIFLQSREKLNYKISQLTDDGVEIHFLESHLAGCGRSYARPSGGSEMYNPIRDCNKLAENDENVRDIFQLINHNFNSWVIWCKIIEILQNDDFKPIKKSGHYFKEVNRLNHTANAYKATGVESRHHLVRISTPPEIMTFMEGESLMREIIIQWLAQKEQKLINKAE